MNQRETCVANSLLKKYANSCNHCVLHSSVMQNGKKAPQCICHRWIYLNESMIF